MTPLELAVKEDEANVVYFFVNDQKMDITKFDEVILVVTGVHHFT